jgi:uncharacterized membrane protein YgcG
VGSPSRSIIINFKGSIGGLMGSTRKAVSEIGRVGNAGVKIGRDLSQALLHGNIKPIIGDVVGGLASMARLVFIMPGLLFALVNPMNVVSMATLNFSHAISAASPQEFVAATRNMAPAMKDAVMATRLLSPEIKNLYGIIQQGFWLGAADDITQLAHVYFPVLGRGLGGISTILGNLRHDLVEFLMQPQVVATINSWFDAFAKWGTSMEPLIKSFFPTLMVLMSDFVSIITNFVLPLVTRLVGLFGAFMNFITPILTGISAMAGLSGGLGGGSGGGGGGGGSSGGGGILGFLGGLVSGAGSFLSGLFGRAGGGPVLGGQSYLVGERGPEVLTMGGGSGYVNPNIHTGNTNVTVKIGEQELRDIVSSEIDRYAGDVAMAARMGRGPF